MEKIHKRIAKEELATALRRRPAASGGGLTVFVAAHASVFACAVIVSKKVAPLATSRNRLRRRVRETLRRISAASRQPFKCVVALRTSTIPEGAALEAALVELLRESGILIQ